MATNDLQERWGRETRLLVLVVVVSLAVLLILARFRFPAANPDVAPPAPSPLANLAGRAAFQDLADTMVTLFGRVAPRVTAVRLEPVPSEPASSRGGRPPEAASDHARAVFAAALRVRPDLAIVHVPAGLHIVSFVGSTDPAEVVAVDAVREVALVRIPLALDTRADTLSDAFAGFAYVGVVGATPNGTSIEPIFVGRTGPDQDERWPAALIAFGPTAPAAGSLLFAVDGRFAGLALRSAAGHPVIVPPSVIDAVVSQMIPAPNPAVEGGS